MKSKWARLGKNGSLGSRFVQGEIKKAKQEITCTADDDAAHAFLDGLEAVEKRALEELYENAAVLHRTKKEHPNFESFFKCAKRIVKDNDSFRLSSAVVDYEGDRVALVRIEDEDGRDLRCGEESPLDRGDRVVARFHLVPYCNDEKRLYGCTCKLLSIVRKSVKKKRKAADYSFALAPVLKKKRKSHTEQVIRVLVQE